MDGSTFECLGYEKCKICLFLSSCSTGFDRFRHQALQLAKKIVKDGNEGDRFTID
jgi:hypothetical protein